MQEAHQEAGIVMDLEGANALDKIARKFDRELEAEWRNWPVGVRASVEGLRAELHDHARSAGIDFNNPDSRRLWTLACLAVSDDRRVTMWATGAGVVPQ